ncbi:MAG: glycosyltransferase family 4 protein [Candidatus Promineifilaceae bacterium]
MRIAFILARYGRSVIGGAEVLARGLVREAVKQDWEVEVWTTCAVDYTTWSNELPSGMAIEEGVPVRRFPVDEWHATEHHTLNQRLLQGNYRDSTFQYDWVSSGPHSMELNQYVMRNAGDFDAIVTMPYLNSIPFDAAWLAGDNVVLVPCLHNEPTAYLEPFRLLLETVSGVIFISPEEAGFALDNLGISIDRSAVIGSGAEFEASCDPKSDKGPPYLLYVGRLDQGKNVSLLYDFVSRYAEEGGDLKLVVAGNGPRKPPDRPEFIYLGPVSDEEKNRLYGESLALCQPSSNESFSLVIMESWLARRPVLVYAGCDVTQGHVRRSKGGLWFDNYQEFIGAVEWLKQHETAAARMGHNGYRYVSENFTWQRIFDKFARTLSAWGFGESR